jgi:[ribosomal protein S5]-alanine N-acetyltransferase
MPLTLEPRLGAHADELFGLLSDPQLYAYLDEAPPASVEALRDKWARSESRKSPDGTQHWLNWIVRDDDGRAAGYVQTTVFPNREANVAYVLGRAHEGKGLATRAVRRMLDDVAAAFDVDRFVITVDHRNERSIRLAERLGFVREAPAPGSTVAAGDLCYVKELRP